jgi:uncharacterized protein YgiM (DUF1202 family)
MRTRTAAPAPARHLPAALAAISALAAALGTPAPARADDQALVRVVSEQAQVHTGPGFGFRVIYLAARGEVLPAIGRATHDHWFRVELPDGTYGWVLGDEVFPLDVDASEVRRGPSVWKRVGDAVFSPPRSRRGPSG